METINRVIIIGWDGAGNFVKDANTPNLDRLVYSGAFTLDAQTASPTISAQCWGSLLHGVSPEKHGLTNDKAGEETYPDDSPYPSIFRVAREAFPDAKLAAFCAWNPINHGIIESLIDVHKLSLKDRELAQAAAAYIRENPDVKLMFVALDLPDSAGHRVGYNTIGQLQAIEETDANTGYILDALEEMDLLKDSLVIVVSDHGGGGEHPEQHGSDHPLDKTIFWACAGPGVIPQMGIPDRISIADTAAVVAYALGLEAPAVWEAMLPKGLFAGNSQ
ncbi:alkaline phosphatase family protein [Paenibacillus filicis]|uniref:Alkaline phosphatase family protein n=1 Tax=Paenibacillus gyeongsangnamensis TaxID=3388067 RepID=A0ABT4QJ52_9BACL|nr:alkaline phosphatase family protein [Paenibacillus filicis]MCZ8516869.1 alkaline phosphatase family protein [Paenibacillus filicis]